MSRTLTVFAVFFYFLAYYFVGYQMLFEDNPNPEFPYLRARFGTIMWHSASLFDPNAASHTYCYYPKAEASYPNKGGEYIIKRQDNGDCNDWFGKAVFYEGSWVSEREKIWWSKDQKILEDMLSEKKSDQSI